MIWFVVALSPTGPISSDATSYLASADVAELPHPPARHTHWSDARGTAHFAGWEAGPQRHALVDEIGLVAFAGLPRPRRSCWSTEHSVGEVLRDGLRSPTWSPSEQLCDAYALVGLEGTGAGVVAMDPLGLHPLFQAMSGDVTVIGNRADLVAQVAARQGGRPARRSQLAATWMALASYPLDDSTGFDGVRLFPQHATARIDAGAVTIETEAAAFVCDPDEPLCDPEELAEELAADVVAALRHAIARSPRRPHLELTGGKDSRLVIAVALTAGLADSFTCATYGPEGLPDMQVARSIAAGCGLAHEDVSGSHFAGAVSVPLLDRYLRHVHRTCGTSDLGNANEPVPKEVLSVAGMLGEIYRAARSQDAMSPPRSWQQAAERFRSDRRPGSMGLIRPEIAAGLVEQATERYMEPRADVRGPEALRLAFSLRSGLPRWQGPLVDLNEHRVLPLYSPTAIRASFRMGHDARAHERVHRYLIERAGRGLAEHPLTNEGWRGATAPRTEIVRGAPSIRQLARAEAQVERRRVLLELFDASADNPLFELVDATTLGAAIERLPERRPREQAQVMGAMAALIWLGGMEQRRRVGDD